MLLFSALTGMSQSQCLKWLIDGSFQSFNLGVVWHRLFHVFDFNVSTWFYKYTNAVRFECDSVEKRILWAAERRLLTEPRTSCACPGETAASAVVSCCCCESWRWRRRCVSTGGASTCSSCRSVDLCLTFMCSCVSGCWTDWSVTDHRSSARV